MNKKVKLYLDFANAIYTIVMAIAAMNENIYLLVLTGFFLISGTITAHGIDE